MTSWSTCQLELAGSFVVTAEVTKQALSITGVQASHRLRHLALGRNASCGGLENLFSSESSEMVRV